jgi:hypothetical protein
MARRINHKHSTIKQLEIYQHKIINGGVVNVKTGSIGKNENFGIKSVDSPYYLEFRLPRDTDYTIHFGHMYGVENTTVKDDDSDPQKIRVIYKVHDLNEAYTPTKLNGDVDVKDPDDQPFDE